MTWIQTITNQKLDLLNPDLTATRLLDELPESLGKIIRFNGHTQGSPFSVAQHCCIGADYLFHAPQGGKLAAAAFLLHDAHEAYINDIPTPVVSALDVLAQRILGASPGDIDLIVRNLKSTLDNNIYQAAGIPWPLTKPMQQLIKQTDVRMLATERRWLLGPSPEPWHPDVEEANPIPFKRKLELWPWHRAVDEYRHRLLRWFPAISEAHLLRAA